MSGARVPFALVGVLLLVGSATFAGSLGGPVVSKPDVDRAMERTDAATQSAVRDAVTTAAVDAARDPVTVRASTPTGRVLRADRPFRDSLRVRIYVAVRDRLDRISHRQGDVTVEASLPATPTADALAEELDRVSISRAGADGGELRATVENVTLTARRDGTVVGQRSISPTVQVPVPTLAVHDRVERFEQRLNAGPAETGLGGRLTAQLYALTWTRGYAQYGGAPISNVLANRHLSLLTNANALTMQREHFGTSDPRGQQVLQWAGAHTAITDAVEGSDGKVAAYLAELNKQQPLDQLPAAVLEETGATTPATAHDDAVTVGVNGTADRAFFETIESLEEPIEQAYTAEVRLRHRVVDSTERVVEQPVDPEDDWELLSTTRDRERSVGHRSAPEPNPEGPWHVFEHYPRTVTVETTTTRLWNTSEGVTETTEVRQRRVAVNVTLLGRHDGGPAPTRPIRTVHERGGPLDGPNLAGIGDRARGWVQTFLDVDELAVETAKSDGGATTTTVAGERPEEAYEYVYQELTELREEVRNVSFETTRGELSTYQVNPGRRLSRKLDRQWDELVDAPDRYAATADRAAYNARVAYLRAVKDALARRAQDHREGRSEIAEELAEHDMPSLAVLQRNYEDRGSERSTSRPGIPMRVETAPSYLTLGELDGEKVRSLPPDERTHPLVARNVNAFTVPYGDVAEGFVEEFLGPSRARLQTAVQTLRAAERANGSDIAVDTARLESDVEGAVNHLSTEASMQVLATRGVEGSGNGQLVAAALGEWETTIGRAEAWLNGSAVDAIHEEVTDRYDLTETQRDELRLRLEVTTRAVLDSARGQPPQPAVNETAKNLKEAGRTIAEENGKELLEKGSQAAVEKVTDRTLGRLPAGLPLAPPFAPWYVTINYWQVEVRGEYTRFTVSVPRGTPETAGARFRYVRDSGAVTLDVDGDGNGERLGRTSRVNFRTQTSVTIAVPPGARGVGDTDGDTDERSPGWPAPG